MDSPTGPQIFEKYWSLLEIPSASRVSRSTFHTENPLILGTKVQNLITWETWHQELVYAQPYSNGNPFFWALSRGQRLHTAITITVLFHKYFNVCHKKTWACYSVFGTQQCLCRHTWCIIILSKWSKVTQGYSDFLATLKITISSVAFTCV